MRNRRAVLIGLALLLVFFIAGCAAGPNASKGKPDAEGTLAGFWLGLWHGMIAPIAFVISLFKDTVSIYDVHNNGHWYDLGFILGCVAALGGGGLTCKRKSRCEG